MRPLRLLSLLLACLPLACGPIPEGGADASLTPIPPDAGEPELDAGTTADAGEEPDAGVEPDAGSPPDAGGPPDSGTKSDAGTAVPVCATTAPAPAAYSGINSNPAFLQVYVNNVENLEVATDPCRGEWKDLFYYMKQNPSPDVFLVQQISGKAQLDFLVQYMTDNLAGIYAGIIAEPNPAQMNSPCGAPKDYQTNAIIYRTGRLTPIGAKETWQVFAHYNGSCRRNFQARTMTVMQKFRDKIANKDVTVASMHWATAQGTGADPACAELNVNEMGQKLAMSGFGGDLLVWGGDANESDRTSTGAFKDWYRRGNGDLGGPLGFRDAIYAHCATKAGIAACLDDNWTIGGSNRIDFLFSRHGNGCKPVLSGQHTITFPEADAAALQVSGSSTGDNYSDHRAVRAAIHY